ncbi:MAG: type II secretion system protein N [Candidatus Binataceae bacterium]|jgi:hypothetical protein
MRTRLSGRYVTALNLVLIAAVAYFAALSADDLISRDLSAGASLEAPTHASRRVRAGNLSRDAYSAIVERDVFNSVKAAPAAAVEASAVNLHVKLLGTSESTAAKPFAILEDTSNHQQALYRLDDEIPDAGTLIAVQRKRVLINHRGQVMSLAISDEVPAISAPSYAADSVPPADAGTPPADAAPAVVKVGTALIRRNVPSPWKKIDPNQQSLWKNMKGAFPLHNLSTSRSWKALRSLGTSPSASEPDTDQ